MAFSFLKKIVPETLFGRSLMIIITPALLLQLLVGIFFFDRHWDAMTERLAQAVAGEISLALKNIELEDRAFLTDESDVKLLRSFKPALGLHITYESNTKLGGESYSGSLIIDEVDQLYDVLRRIIPYNFIIRMDREEKWYEVIIQLKDGLMRVHFPERRLYTATSYIFLLWLIGTSSVLFAIAILFMRNQIRPIRKLAMAADRFGRGIDVPKLKLQGAREVRQATEAFLDMRERLQRQIEQRTAMLSGVSHDLRTPITRMKLQLEMMEQNEDTQALRSDLADMEKMISAYLSFVKTDSDEGHEAADIGELVETLVKKLQRQSLDIEMTDIETGHILRLRQNAIERAVSNLLTNACKFGSKAWVRVQKNDGFIEVIIDDNGSGIPERYRGDVFKPFYRIEDSRNPDTGGIGLGLAVVQDVIHSHGGTIQLEDSEQGGLRVIVRLPLKQNREEMTG